MAASRTARRAPVSPHVAPVSAEGNLAVGVRRVAGRPRRTNNWGLRARPWARRVRTRRDRAASAASERYSRWTALGTLIAGLAGALSLVVSAAVAYQGVAAWRDQTAQDRREADDEVMRQAASVGVWSEGSTTHWWRWYGEPPLDEATADPDDAATGMPRVISAGSSDE